jgi:hypothetical protein
VHPNSTSTNHSVVETVEKLKQILQAKGVTLFAHWRVGK